MKLLMVCLGNICRSPLAEGIMQHLVNENNLGWTVDSAGTGNWHSGEAPHRLSQKTATKNGIDICSQKARQLKSADFLHFDHIFFMDNDNMAEGKRIAGSNYDASKCSLLLDELHPGEAQEVPDPYYGGEQDFHDVYILIEKACRAAINRLSNMQQA